MDKKRKVVLYWKGIPGEGCPCYRDGYCNYVDENNDGGHCEGDNDGWECPLPYADGKP